MKILSPAKLNLFFRVLRKREDGFHEIVSLYQAVSLFDEIHLEFSLIDSLSCTDPTLDLGSSNLVMKALHLFRQTTKITDPIHAHLKKRIPVEAGLGGGSSNAASMLWGLNQLFGAPLSFEELICLSEKLGSDVPFFFSSGTALCEGRGEKIKNISPFPFSAWVAKPFFGLKTPLVYQHTNCSLLDLTDPYEALNRIKNNKDGFFNDLEPAAFSLEPRLVDVKRKLIAAGFETVVMTGSGTAFFCLGSSNPELLSDVNFYFVENAQRKSDAWYPSLKRDVYETEKDL
jgi:4-diphosphocytidyl-2-C-methyl-D-erythritol kinase